MPCSRPFRGVVILLRTYPWLCAYITIIYMGADHDVHQVPDILRTWLRCKGISVPRCSPSLPISSRVAVGGSSYLRPNVHAAHVPSRVAGRRTVPIIHVCRFPMYVRVYVCMYVRTWVGRRHDDPSRPACAPWLACSRSETHR